MMRLVYDAVIVLSGGLTPEGLPSENVRARLDTAVTYINDSEFVILNSRGTPHKPPPLDVSGFPIDEAQASATYLVENHGISPEKILLDSWSKDTIGNGYFAFTNFLIPRQLKKVLVVTSEFHMPRSIAIFDHILGLVGSDMKVSYVASPDVGLSPETIAARKAKEVRSLEMYKEAIVPTITDIRTLNEFIFSKHDAYRVVLRKPELTDKTLLDSY